MLRPSFQLCDQLIDALLDQVAHFPYRLNWLVGGVRHRPLLALARREGSKLRLERAAETHDPISLHELLARKSAWFQVGHIDTDLLQDGGGAGVHLLVRFGPSRLATGPPGGRLVE